MICNTMSEFPNREVMVLSSVACDDYCGHGKLYECVSFCARVCVGIFRDRVDTGRMLVTNPGDLSVTCYHLHRSYLNVILNGL